MEIVPNYKCGRWAVFLRWALALAFAVGGHNNNNNNNNSRWCATTTTTTAWMPGNNNQHQSHHQSHHRWNFRSPTDTNTNTNTISNTNTNHLYTRIDAATFARKAFPIRNEEEREQEQDRNELFPSVFPDATFEEQQQQQEQEQQPRPIDVDVGVDADADADVAAAVMEERLLSEHAQLESFLSGRSEAEKRQQEPQQQQQQQQQQRNPPAPIEESVYNFNRVVVDILYNTIDALYPISISSGTTRSRISSSSSLDATVAGTGTGTALLQWLLGNDATATATATTETNSIDNDNDNDTRHRRPRFEKLYLLETIAKNPFYAYLSVMHLKESLGDRGHCRTRHSSGGEDESEIETYRANLRRIDTMRMHYAQADNELLHLQILEEVMMMDMDMDSNSSNSSNDSGNDNDGSGAVRNRVRVANRVLLPARLLAVVHYWSMVAAFVWNESAAYHFGEVFQHRKIRAYDEFLAVHGPELRTRPVPESAKRYYETDHEADPFLFDTVCALEGESFPADIDGGVDATVLRVETAATTTSSTSTTSRHRRSRPHPLASLYDVLRNVRDDDKEHWMTLCNLVQYGEVAAVESGRVRSTMTATATANGDGVSE